MEPVIVGIDPGTTTAYSVLDIEGEHILTKSSREFDLGTVIKEVIQHGNPLLVGCDKNPAPWFVKKLATKVGAVLVYPEHDLQQSEKKELVDIDTSVAHEFDAYASAKHAYLQYEKVFRKIDEVLEEEGKNELSDDVKTLVVKEGYNIQKAIEVLEAEDESNDPIVRTKFEVIRPKRELEKKDKNIAVLKQKNSRLEQKIKKQSDKIIRMSRRIKGMDVDEAVKKKESTIMSLSNKASRKEAEAEHYRKKLEEFKDFVSRNSGKIFLKKFRNLSSKEVQGVRQGDMLLVEDINVTSEDVIEEIRGKVEVLVYEGKLAVRHDGFVYVSASDLDIEEKEGFAVIDKKQLQKAMSRKNVLKRVVLDYKKKRLNDPYS